MNTEEEQTPELPMHEADLTAEDLDDLMRDLSACAKITFVGIKPTADAPRATALPTPDLIQAMQHILNASAFSIQLRYEYDDAHWVDTLSRTETGYHLLRIKHETM